MKYLLDTHTFLWMAASPDRLSQEVRKIVEQENTPLYLSAASGWEVALLKHLGRIELPDHPQRFIPEAMLKFRIDPVSIGFASAIAAACLPVIHKDPFDRIIIAEAKKENMIVLTKDSKFAEYGIQVLW